MKSSRIYTSRCKECHSAKIAATRKAKADYYKQKRAEYLADGKHVEKLRQYSKRYYYANAEAIVQYSKEYYATHRDEQTRKRREKYKLVDPEIRRQRKREYYAENKSKVIKRSLKHYYTNRVTILEKQKARRNKKTIT